MLVAIEAEWHIHEGSLFFVLFSKSLMEINMNVLMEMFVTEK